jgi:tetratricopeptide (TPR) repeat protein
MKSTKSLSNLINDDRSLTRLVRLALAAFILVTVAFGGYYYWDRYVSVGDQSPLEHGAAQLEAFVRENPNDPDARMTLAQYYYDNFAYDEALEQSLQVLAALPESDGAMLVAGLSYYKLNDTENALLQLEQFAAIHRESPMASTDKLLEMALYFIGEMYVADYQPDKAIPALEEALQIDFTDADAMYQLGLAYAQSNQPEMAVAQYQNAVRFVPDFFEAYSGMADAYAQMAEPAYVDYARGMQAYTQQDYQDALPLLQRAVSSLPDYAPAHLGLGLVYEAMGDLDLAEASVLKTLELAPNDYMANHALGRIQAQAGAGGE